jgi:hypothetical protein
MNRSHRLSRRLRAAAAACALALGGAAALAADVALSGANEVPPVSTAATAKATITVAADGAVSGGIATTGLAGTMAHIHVGAPGKNGPVIVTLKKDADGAWSVPAGARLSPEQLAQYKAGELYVNVHSEAHKGGEIRAQLAP